MEKMLISGGNGFLGSHLAERAIMEGLKVTVLDDFSTSNRVNVPTEVTIIKERVEDISIQDHFEYIVHLAARPSPEDYILNPVETLMSNSIGTMKLLELAKRGSSRFVYTSSSEVYGNATMIPTPETYYGYVSSWGIRSCYDEGKRYSEALTMAYHRKFGLDTRIQRPFNVYGPRIRPDGLYGRVVPRFIQQALNGENITIHGDGKQTRSFLYVDDWVDATWRMITMDDLDGNILNIGSPDEITILELANLIVKKTKSPSKIVHVEKREDDPVRRSADITKAKNLLRWKPETNLDRGLQETIEWVRRDAM
jgi:UDP-glucuronate decarboxylase